MTEATAEAPVVPFADRGAVIPATKLHVPTPRPGLVRRRALVSALAAEPTRKLTLLDAPPGFGKTTLLAEWNASPLEQRPFAWLGLDRADNDPTRFWEGVVEALRTLEPEVGEATLATLRTSSARLVEVALPLLVNDLTTIDRRLVLVLDDYHLIAAPAVHESIEFFIEHLPPTVQLVISTRADPPLSLGRYRARGEMTEVRAADLRLSEAEAAALLNDVLRLGLSPEDVRRLQRRTEGWAAGLYLAALSLRGRRDAPAFVQSFSGDDRHVVDYLSSEVLAGQPGELRDFLLRTSILDRLSGPLCDAVLATQGAGERLEELESQNLFIVPLDTTRDWYRYHHLFGELLRHELRRTDAGAVPELHRRAQRWCSDHGLIGEAIHHAEAAGDISAARELLARHWNDYFNRGRLDTVGAWLRAIPREEASVDPRVCAAGAWLALDQGQLGEAREWIEDAEAGVEARPEDDPTLADVGVLRAVHDFKIGDLRGAQAAAQRVLALEPAGFARFVAQCILGVSQYWSGDRLSARFTLQEAVRLARGDGNDLGQAYALGYLALVELDTGELAEAERLARDATGVSADPGFAEHFVLMVGHLALAKVKERQGRFEDAESTLARALELAERGAGALEAGAVLLALGELRRSRGDRQGGNGLLSEARRRVGACRDPGILGASLSRGAHGPTGPESSSNGGELTDRELGVLRLLAGELTRREIAASLYLSPDTVKTHLRAVYRKLGVSARDQAVERARELHLL